MPQRVLIENRAALQQTKISCRSFGSRAASLEESGEEIIVVVARESSGVGSAQVAGQGFGALKVARVHRGANFVCFALKWLRVCREGRKDKSDESDGNDVREAKPQR